MTAVIIYKDRVLLLKRRNVPVILNPGIWAFLSGGRDGSEKYIETAYREITEESGISSKCLSLLFRALVMMVDRNRGIMWQNVLFIFRSSTNVVKLDYENSKYRWASVKEIENEIDYTSTFINGEMIINAIKGCMNGSIRSKK
ncbi:MAG: NUDIX domain-containing protein [Candidatus Micrarchaeaceae archaeon]